MFDNLSNSLTSAINSLRGRGKLTESNMREGLGDVRTALLEADVAYDVVEEFLDRVSVDAIGSKVLDALDPAQQLIGVVHRELVNLMGPVNHEIPFRSDGTTILMLCGLQGSGKTTTCGKLARRLKEQGQSVMLVAADLQRPAAIEQLSVLGEQLGLSLIHISEPTRPERIADGGFCV